MLVMMAGEQRTRGYTVKWRGTVTDMLVEAEGRGVQMPCDGNVVHITYMLKESHHSRTAYSAVGGHA